MARKRKQDAAAEEEFPELVSPTWLDSDLGRAKGTVQTWLSRYSDVEERDVEGVRVGPPPKPLRVDGKRPVWLGAQVPAWRRWARLILPLVSRRGGWPTHEAHRKAPGDV